MNTIPTAFAAATFFYLAIFMGNVVGDATLPLLVYLLFGFCLYHFYPAVLADMALHFGGGRRRDGDSN